MRLRLAVATLAAVTLSTPAMAQPGAFEVMRGMIERLAANSEGIEDYTLTLRSGPIQANVYVYRDGDEWEVASEGDEQFGDMLEGLVVWPTFHEMEGDFLAEDPTAEDLARIEELVVLSTETLNGRPADVVFVRMSGLNLESEMPDSFRIYLDRESRQILRVHVAGRAEEVAEIASGGGEMDVRVDFDDYRETDGLTVPHLLRMAMDVDLDLSDDERAITKSGIAAARAGLKEDDSEEARQAAVLIDLFLGLLNEGRMELSATVEDVRVNTGPPSWFDG